MVQPTHATRDHGFSLIELMVVIMILAALLGIVLPVVSHVRKSADQAASSAQVNSIADACRQYQLTFNAFPGYLSDNVLADDSVKINNRITGTENLLISLLGRIEDENAVTNASDRFGAGFLGTAFRNTGTDDVVDLSKIGDGPMIKSFRTYGAFYAPKDGELGNVTTQDNLWYEDNKMPELLDARTLVPILYYRGNASRRLTASERHVNNQNQNGAFYRAGNAFYTDTILYNQNGDKYEQQGKSLIGVAAGGNLMNNFAYTLINPTLSKLTSGPNAPDGPVLRGSVALFAPGTDGIYFSLDELGDTEINNADELKRFDDIMQFVE